MVGRAKPAEWEQESDVTTADTAPAPRAESLRAPAEKPRAGDPAAPGTPRSSSRTPEAARHNPTFGVTYWVLGLGASLPAFICAVVLLASAGLLPRVPQVPLGLALGAVLVLLGVGAVFAHANDYPAWTQPGVTLLPILTLFLPAATLRGEVVTRINGDPDRAVDRHGLGQRLLDVQNSSGPSGSPCHRPPPSPERAPARLQTYR